MLDFGTTNDNANAIDMGDITLLEHTGDFTFAFYAYVDSVAGTSSEFLSKWSANTGYIIRAGAAHSDKPALVIGSGAANEAYEADTVLNADTTVRSYMLAFDQAPTPTCHHYINGSTDGAPTGALTIAAETTNSFFINDRAITDGGSGARGQVMSWSVLIGSGGATTYNDGVYIPALENLVFWTRCTIDPPYERVGKTNGTKVNTVAVEALPLTDHLFKDRDTFYFMLNEIFMPFLVGSAAHLGSNLMFNKIEEHTANRCHIDWYKHELANLCDVFRRRPAWAI